MPGLHPLGITLGASHSPSMSWTGCGGPWGLPATRPASPGRGLWQHTSSLSPLHPLPDSSFCSLDKVIQFFCQVRVCYSA